MNVLDSAAASCIETETDSEVTKSDNEIVDMKNKVIVHNEKDQINIDESDAMASTETDTNSDVTTGRNIDDMVSNDTETQTVSD